MIWSGEEKERRSRSCQSNDESLEPFFFVDREMRFPLECHHFLPLITNEIKRSALLPSYHSWPLIIRQVVYQYFSHLQQTSPGTPNAHLEILTYWSTNRLQPVPNSLPTGRKSEMIRGIKSACHPPVIFFVNRESSSVVSNSTNGHSHTTALLPYAEICSDVVRFLIGIYYTLLTTHLHSNTALNQELHRSQALPLVPSAISIAKT